MARTNVIGGLSVVMFAPLLPGVSPAQQATASRIAGVVRDNSGAGVKVFTASTNCAPDCAPTGFYS